MYPATDPSGLGPDLERDASPPARDLALDPTSYRANAAGQVLSSHCALVGLLARKYLETYHPRWPHWAVGALHAGFLHDLGKIDPTFQVQLQLGEPPDTLSGPRIYELSWALTHLAFDPAKVKKLLPGTLPWHVIQYAVFWRQADASGNAWEQKRFANLAQICKRAGPWLENFSPALPVVLADMRAKTGLPVFEPEPVARTAVGSCETPVFRRAAQRKSGDMPPPLTATPSQESMDSAIQTGLAFANRMVSAMSAKELEDELHAWRTHKALPELTTERARDDYTTVPLDCTFTQPLST